MNVCGESSHIPSAVHIHNPSFQQIIGLTRNIPNKELGILLLKPGFFPVDSFGRPLQRHVENLIEISQLKVVATACSILNKDNVRNLYDDLFGPAFTSVSPALSRVRANLEQYMTGGCVFWYLVSGSRAVDKTKVLKSAIRQSYGFIKGSEEVRNAIHSSDADAIDTGLRIMSMGRQCPKESI